MYKLDISTYSVNIYDGFYDIFTTHVPLQVNFLRQDLEYHAAVNDDKNMIFLKVI